MKRVCVFCGSSPGDTASFVDAAHGLARELVARGYGAVYGGARVGVMGALADAVLAAGGEVVGVIPAALAGKEIAHEGLTELHVVDSMHQRKAMMSERADGFIALPGGIGTLEEIFEVLTWAQLGIHSKPCGLLNVDGYYDSLLGFLDGGVAHRFIRPQHRELLIEAADAGALLDAFAAFRPAQVTKWLDASRA